MSRDIKRKKNGQFAKARIRIDKLAPKPNPTSVAAISKAEFVPVSLFDQKLQPSSPSTAAPRVMLTSFGDEAKPKTELERLDDNHVKPFYNQIRKNFPSLETFGFSLHESNSGDRWLEISAIRFPEAERGSGLGSQIIKRITDHADNNGWKLSVTPDARFAGAGAGSVRAQNRLERWYKSYGFKSNSGRKRDYEISETMIREPEAKQL